MKPISGEMKLKNRKNKKNLRRDETQKSEK
jgi:hypothetical protein